MYSFSLRHLIATCLIVIIAAVMIAAPHPIFAIASGPTFGGRITSVSGTPPPCNQTFQYSDKGRSGSICRGGGVILRAYKCKPGGHILGIGAGTIIFAGC